MCIEFEISHKKIQFIKSEFLWDHFSWTDKIDWNLGLQLKMSDSRLSRVKSQTPLSHLLGESLVVELPFRYTTDTQGRNLTRCVTGRQDNSY